MDSLIARLAIRSTSTLLVVAWGLWWRRAGSPAAAVLSVLVLGLAAGSAPAEAYFAGRLNGVILLPAPAPPREVVSYSAELSPATACHPEPQLDHRRFFPGGRGSITRRNCTIVLSEGPIPGILI